MTKIWFLLCRGIAPLYTYFGMMNRSIMFMIFIPILRKVNTVYDRILPKETSPKSFIIFYKY
jgi:hypothetical protein